MACRSSRSRSIWRRAEHKTPEFLALNRFGQVPVIDDNGAIYPDSNAILVYLASSYDAGRVWYPSRTAGTAAIQRWLSAAAGPLLMGPAFARLVGLFNAGHDLDRAHAVATQLLGAMEDRRRAHGGFLVGGRPTIADVAMYTCTAHAPEGHLDLAPFDAIRDWLAAIESLPGFVSIVRTEPQFGLPQRAQGRQIG